MFLEYEGPSCHLMYASTVSHEIIFIVQQLFPHFLKYSHGFFLCNGNSINKERKRKKSKSEFHFHLEIQFGYS